MVDPQQYRLGSPGAGAGFNSYAVGLKHYGGGRNFPTSGRVDPLGYAERDASMAAQRNALLRKLQAQQRGDTFSIDGLREV